MNRREWWHDFTFRRLWEPSITIEAEEEDNFRFWLANFDGEHFYEPHQLRDPSRAINRIVTEAWASNFTGKLIFGLPIYDEVKWTDEQSKTQRKQWVKRESPVDLVGYLAQYGHRITYSRTGETFVIVSTIPLGLSNVVVK